MDNSLILDKNHELTINTDEENQYLTFLLAKELFAIDILNIKEIIEYGQVTEVPMMPNYVRGVINLRGRVVPVIDLLVRFSQDPSPNSKRTCIVIVEVEKEGEKHDLGVVVDSVSAVMEIPADNIEKAPSFGTKVRAEFIEGMGKLVDKFVIILNVAYVLSVDDMISNVSKLDKMDM